MMEGEWMMRFNGIVVPCLSLLLLQGCVRVEYMTKTEIYPGIEWQLIKPEKSRIVWKDVGFSVEGDLFLTFCDHGIDILHDRNENIYLDIVGKTVAYSGSSFVPVHCSDFIRGNLKVFSAVGIMGPYGRIDTDSFIKMKKQFRERIEKISLKPSHDGVDKKGRCQR